MELKPGYKQTEVGSIPDDWCVHKIGQLGHVGRGRVISHREIATSIARTYPVYSSQTSDDGVMGYIDTFDFEGEYITWTTDGVNAGTVFYRNGRFNCTNVCGTIKLHTDNHLFVSRALGRMTPRYVSRNLANPKLMNDVAKEIPVALPPTVEEQRAIAAVLGDVDALLSALTQLIAKKRDLKQAAMQRLLTGEQRLPGFSGEWEVRPFLSAVHIATGQVNPRQEAYKSMVLVAPDHVESGTGRLFEARTAAEQGAISGKYLFSPGDIVYSKIRPYLRKAIHASFYGLCSADMYPLTPQKDVSGAFLLAVLLGHHSSTFAVNVSARSGIPKINREELSQYVLVLPPLPEQDAIAAVFSDMDAEIAALEARLAKTRALKQGMMQELLTGRTRLV